MTQKKVLLLGASGSIGSQTLDLIREDKKNFVLKSFSVGYNEKLIPALLKEFKSVECVYLISKESALKLSKKYPSVKFYYGKKGLVKLTKKADYDLCVDALVGFVGMEPAIVSLKRNKILCLANKEALVSGGTIINKLLSKGKGKLYPIDSEHVAIAKCLSKCNKKDVKKVLLTASGGALRNIPINKLNECKASDALKHPTWKMGNKITIDCATMMNKGFEIIEAYYLFGFKPSMVEVTMHDESLMHSGVELKDGRILLDYGKPDMHNPIRWALYEGNIDFKIKTVKKLSELKGCHFHKYDPKRYPCTELAISSLKQGASKMIALNASNEVMVNKYLNGEIKFLDISKNIAAIVGNTSLEKNPSLSYIKHLDKFIRREAQ